MYVGELGFSLKPPKWLRNSVINPIKEIIGGGTQVVPTPAGTVQIQLQQPTQPSALDQFTSAIPGGGKTLLIAGAVGLGLWLLTRQGRRR